MKYLSGAKARFVAVVAVLCCCTAASAQWRLGITGGIDWNYRHMETSYQYAQERNPRVGTAFGLMAQYDFRDWVGIRCDYQMAYRNYRDDYTLTGEYYDYKNIYHLLPITVSFSFGGEYVRGFANIGGYVGHWTAMTCTYKEYNISKGQLSAENTIVNDFDKQRDRRIDAGLTAMLGVGYSCSELGLFVNLETVLYYGLVNNHKTGSEYISQPAYDTTPVIQIAIGYVFPKYK